MSNISDEKHESFRDKVSTIDKKGHRVWLYPHKPKGKLYNIRSYFSYAYILLFFILPFLKYEDHPIFLINVVDRKFILFGQIFWTQDFFIFALLMVTSIVLIALFTVIFGRVFCGWICPQTIFSEMIFRKIDYLIEGSASKQRIIDSTAWNGKKLTRKIAKWTLEWIVSFIIANGFLSYIIGIDELWVIIKDPIIDHIGGFISISAFTSLFFFIQVWMREQVCTLICPFGRMQAALLDKDSIVVAYDYVRGEPRGKFNKSEERSTGDCIDCELCVRVCPTGIDIRNGTQMECVNCTACIDACNGIMKSIGLPKGLIRFDSENSIATKVPFKITWRMFAYSFVMCILSTLLIWLIMSRTDVGVTILRTPGQLYQEQPNHQISNLYNYKLLNKTFKNKEIILKPDNFEGTITLVGESKISVPKNGSVAGAMFIYLDSASVVKRKTELKIGMYEGGKKIKTISTNFLGPFSGS